MPLYEVKYHIGDSSLQSTIVNAATKEKAQEIVEEELKELGDDYKITDVGRI